MKLKILILIFFCFILTQANATFGQELSDKPIPSNSSGEIHSSFSDMMRVAVRQSGERLFVIVRLGDGETSRRVVTARINAAKTYFSRDADFKAIFAEGERVRGEGRFEYYLGSNCNLLRLRRKTK